MDKKTEIQKAHAAKLEADARRKAKAHLLKLSQLDGTEYCCLKLRNSKGGWPLNYGVVFPGDVCKIFLRDASTGELTDETQEWNSIDEMLNAGWDVD